MSLLSIQFAIKVYFLFRVLEQLLRMRYKFCSHVVNNLDVSDLKNVEADFIAYSTSILHIVLIVLKII